MGDASLEQLAHENPGCATRLVTATMSRIADQEGLSPEEEAKALLDVLGQLGVRSRDEV